MGHDTHSYNGGLGYHIIIRANSGRVLAPGGRERRIVARSVLHRGREFGLLTFRAPDTHLHSLNAAGRDAAGEFARRVETSLTRQLDVEGGFADPRFIPIEHQRHLERVFRYIQNQRAHHGVELDPWHEASNLLDLLSFRLLGRYTIRSVRTRLPRVTREELEAFLGCPVLEVEDPTPEEAAEVVATAAGLVELGGHSREANRARRAVLEAVGRRATTSQMAEALSVSASTIKRLRSAPVDTKLVAAIRRQVGLRRQLRQSGERFE